MAATPVSAMSAPAHLFRLSLPACQKASYAGAAPGSGAAGMDSAAGITSRRWAARSAARRAARRVVRVRSAVCRNSSALTRFSFRCACGFDSRGCRAARRGSASRLPPPGCR